MKNNTREKAGTRSLAQQRFFTERDIAAYSGLSVKTLQAWRLYSRGPEFCHFGKSVRYDLESFDKWAAAQVIGAQRVA